MHAVTIRRLIVFGVCALGVGSLYLVPSIARSPEQLRLSGPTDEPTTSPAGAGPSDQRESSSPTGTRQSPAGGGVASGDSAPDTQRSATRNKSADAEDDSNQKPGTGQAKAGKDSDPPQPVADIEASKVTARRLTISWPAASDNVGVIGYRIWLNGFEVATTAETRARLRWFNDDSGQHVVQIRALDAAGNQSQSSPTLVITRPSPEPTATPTPEPSDSPTPAGEPSEHSHPDAQSPESPSESATGQKSTAEPTPH
jgi:hypothetical protein